MRNVARIDDFMRGDVMQGYGKGFNICFSTSKFILYFASLIYFMTWCAAAYSWFADGTFPDELIRYTSVLFGVAFGSYCCKTAYEYKADKDCEASIQRGMNRK